MSGDLPEAAYAAALTALPGMSLKRLAALLADREPSAAYAVACGRSAPAGLAARILSDGELREKWRLFADLVAAERLWRRCEHIGATVSWSGGAGHPTLLASDPQPPPVLFSLGDRELLEHGRRVGIVGTRNATPAGRHAAHDIAGGLACRGVHIVSGLARGIDGDAHRALVGAAAADEGDGDCVGGPGAQEHMGAPEQLGSPERLGRPIGVVACGLDVVYPREHRSLWHAVAQHGLLLSEAPPGAAPEAYRFPMRNRIIAALSEVLVVVESREKGGSLITAAAAGERGIPVMAVPGGLYSRASLGTNNLLREGSAAAVDASDVLIALSLEHRRSSPVYAEQRPRPRGDDVGVYRACCEEPRTIDGITLATGRDFVQTAMSLARLEQAGWIADADGWYQAAGAPLR